METLEFGNNYKDLDLELTENIIIEDADALKKEIDTVTLIAEEVVDIVELIGSNVH